MRSPWLKPFPRFAACPLRRPAACAPACRRAGRTASPPASASVRSQGDCGGRRAAFFMPIPGAVMHRLQRIVSATAVAALLAWAVPAGAAPTEPEGEPASAGSEATGVPAAATWLLIEARDHARGTSGAAAVLFGVAQERGRQRQAHLRVDCFEGRTTLHVDTGGLRLGPSVAAVAYSLDRGPFVSASWQASADGRGLDLSGDR